MVGRYRDDVWWWMVGRKRSGDMKSHFFSRPFCHSACSSSGATPLRGTLSAMTQGMVQMHLSGTGTAFLEGHGTVLTKVLAPGEKLVVDEVSVRSVTDGGGGEPEVALVEADDVASPYEGPIHWGVSCGPLVHELDFSSAWACLFRS
jgi:hypothetical protein